MSNTSEHESNKGCILFAAGGIIISGILAYYSTNNEIANGKYIGNNLDVIIHWAVETALITFFVSIVAVISHTMYQNYKNPKSNNRP